jgi:hypothetical protein
MGLAPEAAWQLAARSGSKHANSPKGREESLEIVTQSDALKSPDTGRLHAGIVLLVSLILQTLVILASYHFAAIPPLTSWGFENIAIARSLHAGNGFSSPFFSPSGPTAFIAPGYPLLLAGIMKIFGTGSAAATFAIVLQVLCVLGTVFFVMKVAQNQFGNNVGNLAGLICVFSPATLIMPVKIWDTSVSALLVVLIFAAVVSGQVTRARFVPAGVLCAIAGLINPSLLPTLFVLCAWSAWQAKKVPWLGLLAFLVCFSAWPVRNALVMHAFIPLRTDFGYELWMGNHPGANGDFVESMNPMMDAGERKAFLSMGEVAYLNEKGEFAMAYILSHPGVFFRLSCQRVVKFWFGPSQDSNGTEAPLVLGGLIGFVLLRKRRMNMLLYAIPLIIFPLPYYITHVYARFQYVIDPLLAVLAAHAINSLLLRKRQVASPANE